MSAFEYTALDARGRTRKGVIDGDNARAVRGQLLKQGLSPLTVAAVQRRAEGQRKPLLSSRGVGAADLALATRQLATLTRAAMPLEEALGAISGQTGNRRLQAILQAVRAKVLEGHDLAMALGEYPDLFPGLYRESVAAGERTGQLDQVFERLADHLETSRKLHQSVGLAMIYPIIVLTFALLVTIALLTYVVPEVTRVFTDFDQELPWLTRALIAVSDFLQDHGGLLLVLAVAVPLTIRLLLRREGIRVRYHRLLLTLPLVSRLTRGMNSARFARTFGILTGSGVPVLEGLAIAGRVVDNLPMRRAVEAASERVREGGNIHQALGESRLFAPMVIHLIASGEASGDLAGMLDRAATVQEQEVETLVATLAGLLEPLLILFMGGMVLTIVIAILLPIFDLNQLIQ